MDEAKKTLRLSLSDTTHDNELLELIDAAVEQLEQDTDRCLITQQMQWTSDTFPKSCYPIQIHVKPIESIDSIEYIDTDEAPQTLSTLYYGLNKGNRQIYLNHGYEWPAAINRQESVTVKFQAGYGTEPANVPKVFKRAILLQVGKWFTDPVMESGVNYAHDMAYQRIVRSKMRTSYP